ncbi:hypothetical protein HAZT_HAZT009227 [Hyalella azteca]|uniref:Uncharacterized protein n=1 Tax=Hyalella azteca TaxID=294128 RepID=A0A6A0GT23_HYAAZ|nr:hypothetical protein HAZT_HAZT009227 [Hyalella azteca]
MLLLGGYDLLFLIAFNKYCLNSKPVLEYTKAFITSVVVGKDVVPRIGLHQMETLRADLITAIQHSQDPKWKTIASTMQCCGSGAPPVIEDEAEGPAEQWSSSRRKLSRNPASHPSDATIELTVHRPLYPPGRILHVVRHHPGPGPNNYRYSSFRWRRSGKPVYQAVWVDNEDFGEVIISPCMIQDHMPDKVLEALELPTTKTFSNNVNRTDPFPVIFLSISEIYGARHGCFLIDSRRPDRPRNSGPKSPWPLFSNTNPKLGAI